MSPQDRFLSAIGLLGCHTLGVILIANSFTLPPGRIATLQVVTGCILTFSCSTALAIMAAVTK